MAAAERYELLEKIGSGSFATVYRAKDGELGREVAIKQLHQEFLDDPGRLDRYWEEAQLVAQLHHPNIVTIFDIDRGRGWLVMELMQANLADRMLHRQMDLKSLRTTVGNCLRVLKYLHERGIIHGDIKPSNMMIDERRRIKIGDFGLARRVANEEGSLLKGTTKYMAPEVVSDEFGEIGPASDLYSLGFTAYDLVCGPNFESLFPGMSAYGRNKQAAWLMWHAAADRRLPKVQKVLEGVPDDLARVIDKLIEKDQSQRYKSADEALADLSIHGRPLKADDGHAQNDRAETARPSMSTQRKVAVCAFAASLILCGLLLFPFGQWGSELEESQATGEPIQGIVGQMVLAENLLIIDQGPDHVPKEIRLQEDARILLNGEAYILLRELQAGDRVSILSTTDATGKPQMEVAASRPERTSGYVKELEANNEQFMLVTDEDRSELLITVAGDTEITLNGKPARFPELKDDDRVEVYHVADESVAGARAAASIVAYQTRTVTGFVREMSVEKDQLTIEVNHTGESELVELAIADKCNVTVNGQQVMNGKLLKPADLQPGDRVTVSHHIKAIDVRAVRRFHYAGVVLELNLNTRTIVVNADATDRKVFLAGEKCECAINGKPAALDDLRRHDRVELMYDRSGPGNAATSIDATRPFNTDHLAIVIGIQDYDDTTLTKLPYAVDDAKLLHETLLTRYACEPDQLLLLTDETRVRLEQAIPAWLSKVTADSQIVVYFCGHAYRDDNREIYLAGKDFALSRIAQSGLSLRWLRDQLEACAADEKLLLLDCCHDGEGEDLSREPSTSEMIQSLKPPSANAVFTSTTAIASNGPGERGRTLTREKHGLFGYVLAEAYSGKADKNRDVHLEPTELFAYAKSRMEELHEGDKTQTPTIFIPEDTPPPRLSENGKLAVRNLIGDYWDRSRLSAQVAKDFEAASELVRDEPDAALAYALILLKIRDRKNAIRFFDEVKFTRPELLLPYEAAVWIQFTDEHYRSGMNIALSLSHKLVDRIERHGQIDDTSRRLLIYLGKLREFADSVAETSRQPSQSEFDKLDEHISQQHVPESEKLFQQGRDEVSRMIKAFTEQIENEKSTSKIKLLKLDRKRFSRYVSFDFSAARRTLFEDLKK